MSKLLELAERAEAEMLDAAKNGISLPMHSRRLAHMNHAANCAIVAVALRSRSTQGSE